MSRHQPRFRILHHLLEAVLVLADAWPGRTTHDVVAGAIHYLAQAVGLKAVVYPFNSASDAAIMGEDAPF